MLAPRVMGASVLDLYAGSGALGLEALSRGADRAILVDNDHEAVRTIDHNLRELGYQQRALVKRMRAERFVNLAITAGWCFGVIFCDPPWAVGLSVEVRDNLHHILDPDGLILVEHQKADPPPVLDQLAPMRDRAWGDTRVTWYQVPVKGGRP